MGCENGGYGVEDAVELGAVGGRCRVAEEEMERRFVAESEDLVCDLCEDIGGFRVCGSACALVASQCCTV